MDILISGALGQMGQVLAQQIEESADHQVIAGYDKEGKQDGPFPIIDNLNHLQAKVDMIIDFSLPSSLTPLLTYACQQSLPLVIATTGYSEEEEKQIQKASQTIPILHAKNMSLGINMIEKVIELLAASLKDFDIEIIEKHHRYKKDAPSGTAKMLLESCQKARPSLQQVVEGRSGQSEGRPANEIGVSSVRAGTIVGEHRVIFAGEDEVLEISHQAQSKKIFAHGAIQAAEFLEGHPPALYDMDDVLGGWND